MTGDFFNLVGRIAVVVGGTSGIGRSIALALAAAGADVVATGRRQEQVQQAAQEIEQVGRRTLRHSVNVQDRSSMDSFRDAVVAAFGSVHILVNCAGQTFRKPTAEVAEDEWNRVLDVNLTGTLRACQCFFGVLRESGKGRVINIASLTSYVGFMEVTAYAASKSAVLGLTRNLAVEWARDGICVNAIAPGVFLTDLNRELLYGTERGRELLLRTPMARFGNVEELGGLAVFLASDAASFITGQCIAVDGGFLSSGVNQ